MPKTRLGESMYRHIDQGLRQSCEDAGLPTVRCHDLRHSHATIRASMTREDVLGQLVPISALALARELGHRDTDMLSRVYFHDSRIIYGLRDLDFALARDVEERLLERQRQAARVHFDLPELSDPPCVVSPPDRGRGLLRARLWRAYQAGIAAREAAAQAMKLDSGTSTSSQSHSFDTSVLPEVDGLPPELTALLPARLAWRARERDRLLLKLWRSWVAGRAATPWLFAVEPRMGDLRGRRRAA